MSTVIEALDLKKSFTLKGSDKIVQAVRGVNFSIQQGEVFGFLGPNGAGKTTCQRMLTTLLPIEQGSAFVAGFDVKRKPREVRRRIGYIGQLGGSDLTATGRENLMLSGQLYGMSRRETENKTRELAVSLELTDFLDRIVQTYSGGQRRRLEIALGIIHKPEIVFMDEPTAGLDPQNRANLWEHIRRLKGEGITVFLTTHYLDEADILSDRLAIIDQGQIVAEGTPAELKRQISGDVITLRLKNEDDAGKAVNTLRNKDFINEIKQDEYTAVLYVHDGAAAMRALFEMLKSNEVNFESISLSAPSLDDVFLKQTGRALRDAGKEEVK